MFEECMCGESCVECEECFVAECECECDQDLESAEEETLDFDDGDEMDKLHDDGKDLEEDEEEEEESARF